MDKFDDIWNNRFNSEKLPVDDWTNPDDVVWSSISTEIFEEKKKSNVWLFWLSGLFIIITAFYVLSKNKNNKHFIGDVQVVNNIEEAGTSVKTKSLEKTTTQNLNKSPKNNSLNLDEKPKNIKTSKSTPLKNKASINDLDTKQINNGVSLRALDSNNKVKNSSISNLGSLPKIQDVFSFKANAKSSNEITLTNKGEKLDQISILKSPPKSIPTLSLVPINSNTLNLPSLEVPAKKLSVKDTSNKNVSIGVYGGMQLWQHKVSSNYLGDLSPFDFSHTNGLGWVAGLNIEYAINNKLSLFMNPSFEEVKTTSGHNSNLKYNVSNETDAANDYNLSLATPFGFSEANFLLFRRSDVGAEEIDLLVDFESNHNIKNISLGFGVKLDLFKASKFGSFISLGGGINQILEIRNSINQINTNHRAIVFQDMGTASYMNPDLNKWHFDVRGGLGLNYQFSNNVELNLAYNFINGLNPIFELNDYKTKVNRSQIQIGLLISRF